MVDPVGIRTRRTIEQLKRASESAGLGLAGGGGGDHTGGMELERRVARLEEAVTAIRLDIAEMKGKLSNLPTTWQLIGVNFGLVVGVAGLVFAVARMMK
jgi:hypothetical protein